MTSPLLQRGVRAIVPYLFLPLCLIASVLSAAPWLRSFPSSIAAAPLYGAAVLSVLIPLVVVRIKPGWLWLSILIDAVAFAAYALLVVIKEPVGFADFGNGLFRGPSQILTFALPLVSPRSLMVAPAALIWLAGTVAGECVARRWYTMLPYVGFLVAFGLAYAGTQRAAGTDVAAARSRETVLAAALLVTLLLMRVAQAWVQQDETAESTEPEGVLPLRGLLIGTVTALVVAVLASFAVQTSAFPKRAETPQRIPTVDQSRPLTPLAFVAGLRPHTAQDPGQALFTVTTDRSSEGYFAIANVDFYDGAGWSFTRTFRPSGGVLPADTDPALRTTTAVLTQHYAIDPGPLTQAPWMPFVYRAQKVTGTSVNIDPASGMIVPETQLRGGTSYTVRSAVNAKTFDQVKARTASADTATPTIDTQLPGSLRAALDRLVRAFAQETGTPMSPALPFLQALQRDLRTKYSLSNAAQGSATGTTSATPTPTSSAPSVSPSSTPKPSPKSATKSHRPRDFANRPVGIGSRSAHRSASSSQRSKPRPSPKPSATPSGSAGSGGDVAGGTGFADVLASILGPSRNGTPEQFATLLALVARDLGVPARVATGFRVEPTGGAAGLPGGRYDVTTADAWTWTEIPINGVGWVVLDGSPARFSKDNKPTESGAPPPSSSSAPPSQNPLITQGNGGNAVAPKSAVPHSSSTATDAVLIAILAALGLLLLVIVVVLLSRKRVRAARRRRSPDPRVRLIGAWQESLDMLAEAGLPDLHTLTSAEIAALTGEQFGADTAAATASLGDAANSVAYSTGTVIADADADAAWARHRTVRKQVHRQLGMRGRLSAGMRYHRAGRVTGPVSPDSWADAAVARSASNRSARERRRARENRVDGQRYQGRRRSH